MSAYFIKNNYKENLKNLYYDDNPSDNVIWQPDVYRFAIEYAKKHKIKNIIDIGSGNGDKLLDYKDKFNITFIDYGANLEIIKQKFNNSKKRHLYLEQNFEESFPELPLKKIKDSVVICSDVIEHIRDMNNLCEALIKYSKLTRMLAVSTPDRERLYGFDHDGVPTNKCHVREWRIDELKDYFFSAGMEFLIGLTRTNDRHNLHSTLYVLSGKDFKNKKDLELANILDPNILTKVISKNELVRIFKKKKLEIPKFDDKFCGLYNPYAGNYMLNHFISAVSSGISYGVNKFKFIDQQSYYNSVGSSNIDCSILQYIESSDGDYPISFTYLYEGDLTSRSFEDRLLTISAEQLAIHYLPEMILGFNLLDKDSVTLARLPNYTNLNNELTSHMTIKRSAKLLAGNVKRKFFYEKK